MADIPYRLVASAARVRGLRKSAHDPYDGDSVTVDDVHVELVQRGAEAAGAARTLRTGDGSQAFSVGLTSDGRVQSIEYKRVGAGPAVVTAAAKLVGFIASTALSAVRLGALAGEAKEAGDGDQVIAEPRKDWAAAHPEAAALLASNKSLAKAAAEKLAEVRTELLTASDLPVMRNLAARERAISEVVDDARAEVARLEALYIAWRESQRTSSTATIECTVDIANISSRQANQPATTPPTPPVAGDAHYQLWADFNVILEVVDPRRANDQPARHAPERGSVEDEARLVRWRVPRAVELWVWKKDPGGSVVLVTRTPIRIADERSDTHAMELRASAFGEHGGAWTFDDDGAPTAIKTDDKSTAGALADALSSLPETLVGAVEQGKKLNEAVAGIQDAAAEREKAAAERELATAKARIDLLGVNATAHDMAAVARAEQAVKLRTATRATSPSADMLDDLKAQLELQKTRDDLAAQRRTAQIEGDLAATKAEVARLEQEVLAAKARWNIEHPDKAE